MTKIKILASLIVLLAAGCFCASAQDPKAAIQQELVAKYPLTQPTADKTDIVTAGCVLVLKKSNLMMVDVTSKNLYQNTYKGGKITQNALGRLQGKWNRLPGAMKAGGTDRTFVAGEKIWVTGIDVKDTGVVFDLFTDAISDIRYEASLTFPFSRGSVPPQDEVNKLVSEVFDVQPMDDAKGGGQQAGPAPQSPAGAAPGTRAASPPPPAEAAPAPIAPPPPPPADPKTIALKQTTDQVVANFGQPTKIIKLGAKEIYVYPDMKVTFVAGKVTDVQ